MSLPTRRIGDLSVSSLGLGCMGMSLAYGRPDPAEASRTVQRAIEVGITLFDTADVYGKGANEAFVGKQLRHVRDEIMIATKVGLRTNVLGIPNRADGRPAYLREAIDNSLARLGTDHVDIMYLHRVDPKIQVEESVAVLADAVRAGKVREIGLSEATADELRRADQVHPIAAIQTEWSLFSREIEDAIAPTARELGVSIVPYSPLGRGMLTGSPTATTNLPLLDFRRTLPRWRKKNLQENLRQVQIVQDIASRVGATPAQVALAWLLHQGNDVVPIPGTKHARYLEDNVGACAVELSTDDLQLLDSIAAQGDRYSRESATPGVGRETGN